MRDVARVHDVSVVDIVLHWHALEGGAGSTQAAVSRRVRVAAAHLAISFAHSREAWQATAAFHDHQPTQLHWCDSPRDPRRVKPARTTPHIYLHDMHHDHQRTTARREMMSNVAEQPSLSVEHGELPCPCESQRNRRASPRGTTCCGSFSKARQTACRKSRAAPPPRERRGPPRCA
jgi:hypothetical protein